VKGELELELDPVETWLIKVRCFETHVSGKSVKLADDVEAPGMREATSPIGRPGSELVSPRQTLYDLLFSGLMPDNS